MFGPRPEKEIHPIRRSRSGGNRSRQAGNASNLSGEAATLWAFNALQGRNRSLAVTQTSDLGRQTHCCDWNQACISRCSQSRTYEKISRRSLEQLRNRPQLAATRTRRSAHDWKAQVRLRRRRWVFRLKLAGKQQDWCAASLALRPSLTPRPRAISPPFGNNPPMCDQPHSTQQPQAPVE